MTALATGIVILPDERTSSGLIRLSRVIHDNCHGSDILLGDVTLPHVSVYIGAFPRATLSEVAGLVRSLQLRIAQLPPIDLVGCHSTADGLVMLDSDRPAVLVGIHEEVMLWAPELSRGHIAKLWTVSDRDLPAKAFKNLRETGYPYGRDLWSPHFTIAKVSPERVSTARKLTLNRIKCWQARKIVVAEMSDHGQIQQIIEDDATGK